MEPFWTITALQDALPVLLKLLIAAVLGAAIGMEREAAGRPAGVRTHMLIVIGVTLICEVSKVFGGGDPARIAAQIVTGIGFLGAGTILRMGLEIKGLTSAASIWAASGVGMAVSAGGAFVVVAVLSTALILVTLAFVSQVERRFYPRSHPRELWVRLAHREDAVGLVRALGDGHINVRSVRVGEDDPLALTFTLSGRHDRAVEVAAATPGVVEAAWLGG